MDDCGDYEILPGIMRGDTDYEGKKLLAEKLDNHCQSWGYVGSPRNYWTLKGVNTEYFDNVYSPYIYHIIQHQSDLYEKVFTPNYVDMVDPYFTVIINIQKQCVEVGKRQSMLICVVTEQQKELNINFDLGIGQFLPTPICNDTGVVYLRKHTEKQSVWDSQTICDVYDGNVPTWVSKYDLVTAYNKCSKGEWPIVSINGMLNNSFTCVSTIDVLNRLLLMVDLCGNIDFYFWLGNCVEMWTIWPEINCENITAAHFRDIEKDIPRDFETMLNEHRLLRRELSMFKRPNLYLGCNEKVVKEALPFYSFVSNGLFTLEGV